jgi:hypothetical protein
MKAALTAPHATGQRDMELHSEAPRGRRIAVAAAGAHVLFLCLTVFTTVLSGQSTQPPVRWTASYVPIYGSPQ